MPKVSFYPSKESGDVSEGTTILDASEQLGVELKHDCGGFATCSSCRIMIVHGVENLSEIDLDEENMLEEAELPTPFRLSCQALIQGDVVLRIPDSEMDWSKGALRELNALPSLSRAIIRVIVEARARKAGEEVILPDTAIPAVALAKEEVDAIGDDAVALSALVKAVCEGSSD
ncbi:MAG: 2Fe-2S iron-sulfur cluster-binding protein [Nitrospirota bacterium]|nr:2Fe-2S iron-sulfur cluster-binding protein [Nitrospirota bacterium]